MIFTVHRSGAGPDWNLGLLVLGEDSWMPLSGTQGGTQPQYMDTDHIVYGRSGSISILGFDLESLMPAGVSQPAVSAVHTRFNAGMALTTLVAQRVEELRAELADRTRVSVDNIVDRCRRMAMLDITQLLTLDEERSKVGRPVYRYKRPDELSEDQRGMLSDVTITERKHADGTIEQRFSYKIFNAKDALDALARTLGMFRDKVEHEHSHKVRALFEFVSKTPETSELVARIRARHGMTYDPAKGKERHALPAPEAEDQT